MPATDFQSPVSQLLSYGNLQDSSGGEWFDYVEAFDFTDEHIPDLIRLASEKDLDWQDEVESFAPIHAFRALGQLKAEEAIQPLLLILDEDDNDWYMDELPQVFGMIGPVCIPVLADYLNDDNPSGWCKAAAARGLVKVAEFNPDYRDESVKIITMALSRHQNNPPELNGSLVGRLLSLKATESVSVIEKAYKEGPMDEMVCGSWARVQIDLGLASASDFTPEELKPKPSESMKPLLRLAELFKQAIPFDDTTVFPTNMKPVSEDFGLQLLEKGGRGVKKSKSTQPKTGFGSERSPEKIRKKKR
jgi:hypothetical protein